MFLILGTCVSQCIRREADSNRYNFLHCNQEENSILHSKFNTAYGPHIVLVCVGILFASWSRRKSNVGYQHFTVTCRLPTACLQNTATYFISVTAHSQISALYIHNEYCQYIGHCYHNKLEFQRYESHFYFLLLVKFTLTLVVIFNWKIS